MANPAYSYQPSCTHGDAQKPGQGGQAATLQTGDGEKGKRGKNSHSIAIAKAPKKSNNSNCPLHNLTRSHTSSPPLSFSSYLAKMSSNCCGRKRPSLSYVSELLPCFCLCTRATQMRRKGSGRTMEGTVGYDSAPWMMAATMADSGSDHPHFRHPSYVSRGQMTPSWSASK